MEQEQLERLRHMNQDLLQRLKANQEEFRKRIPIKPQSPSLLPKGAAPKNHQVPDARNGKENQGQFPKDKTDTMTTVSVEAGPWVARSGLGHPTKPTAPRNEPARDTHQQGHPCTEAPGGRMSFAAAGGGSARETCKAVKDGGPPRSPRKRVPAGHPEAAKKHSANLCGEGSREKDRPKTGVEPSQTRAKGSHRPGGVSARVLQTPKSILLTPGGKDSKEKMKKEAGRVTFMSDPEEYTIPADDWSVRPFLGYDWIAGLLDMDSSVSEKPDQYFSELQDFRRVNREACISDRHTQSAMSGPLTLDEESAADLASHQCVFCYRLNQRLFTEPVDSESACPICKTPRARQPPETLVEPAFVRVSIPRSTLLPAYKHKIHRRKSYEPADDLALPTHCLAGWENPVQPFSPTLSSLDLRSSLASKSPGRRLDRTSRSRVSGGTRTDELLDLSHATEFELANACRLWDHREASFHWNSWQPWVCMCDLHKQARIWHFVVWAANVSLDLKASDYWQEQACSLEDCGVVCMPEECPGKAQKTSSLKKLLPPPVPPTLKIPLPSRAGGCWRELSLWLRRRLGSEDDGPTGR